MNLYSGQSENIKSQRLPENEGTRKVHEPVSHGKGRKGDRRGSGINTQKK